MFDRLTEGFSNAFRRFSGQGRISETNVREAVGDVRTALLEADVQYDPLRSRPASLFWEIAHLSRAPT